MNKLSVKIIIVCILLVFCSCDYSDNKFTIINETNRPLFWVSSSSDSIDVHRSIYEPFRESTSNSNTTWIESSFFIKPRGMKRKGVVNTTWEDMIRGDYFKGQMYVFIFEADTLEKYDWEDVKKNNRYFRKYRLTVDDLRKLDWKVRVTEEEDYE